MKNLPTLVIALLICFISIFLHGLFGGFELGAMQNRGVFNTFGSGYQVLANSYFYIYLLLLLYTITNFIKYDFLAKITGLFFSLLALYPFRNIYLQKALLSSDTGQFTLLMQQTIPLDWFCFLLLLALISIQLIDWYALLKTRDRNNLEMRRRI